MFGFNWIGGMSGCIWMSCVRCGYIRMVCERECSGTCWLCETVCGYSLGGVCLNMSASKGWVGESAGVFGWWNV